MAFQLPEGDRSPGDDSCAGGRISHVFIDNHSIFDPSAIPDDGKVRWAYTLANRVHMRTREEFIRNELLFREGDCFDTGLVQESARALRAFRFIAGADVYGVSQPDGTTHVVVDTRDEWTTKLALSARFDDGIRFEGGYLVEENFLGRGIALGAFYLERDQRRDVGGLLAVPRIRHSRWDGRLSAAATRIGGSLEQAVIHPFTGEHPGVGLRQTLAVRRDLFSYLLPGGSELSHVVIPLQEERAELGLARRVGAPGHLFLYGGGLTFERVGLGSPDEAEAVRGGSYGDRVPAAPELASALEGQLHDRQALRLNILLGYRGIRFVERRGYDAVTGLQDLPLGREATFTVGHSLGSTQTDQPGDLFSRVDLFRGGSVGPLLAFLSLSSEGRRRQGSASGGNRWRDVLAEARGLAYWHPSPDRSTTLVLQVAAQGGWHTDSPFQLSLGGPDGVRGYSETDHPGGRRFVASLEGRWELPGPFPDLFDVGATAFTDAGRMWAGDVPFGQNSGWRTTVGAGLRLGFPTGSSRVIRIDVAVPTDAGVPHRPILRISAREWIGLLEDTRNVQLLRSRRSGLSSDFTGVAQERRPPG